jgi:hypothetical protein
MAARVPSGDGARRLQARRHGLKTFFTNRLERLAERVWRARAVPGAAKAGEAALAGRHLWLNEDRECNAQVSIL